MILQLEPPIPLLTPKGPALAVVLLDYGAEHHLMWVCIQDETGEIWTWPNTKVRGTANPTMGRPMVQPPGLEKHDTNSANNLDKQRPPSGASIPPAPSGYIRGGNVYSHVGGIVDLDRISKSHGD